MPIFIAGQVWIKHHGESGSSAEFDYLAISGLRQHRAMPHFTRRDMPNCPAQVCRSEMPLGVRVK